MAVSPDVKDTDPLALFIHRCNTNYVIIIIIIIGIQPLGRFGQRPELSQATGMALVR